MSGSDAGQPKLTTPEGIRLEAAARYMLGLAIGVSVNGRPRLEYGGVIYRDGADQRIRATGPVQGEAITVDVGQNLINMGLPQSCTPLAWYHTHPARELPNIQFGGRPAQLEWDKFIGGDKGISDYRQIYGYVATMDGRVWRYDPPPEVQGDDYGPGRWGALNGAPLSTAAKELLRAKVTSW